MASPVSRYKHVAAAFGSRIIVWGGWTKRLPLKDCTETVKHKKNDYLSRVDILDMGTCTWKESQTKGRPHQGVIGASCVAIDDRMILFGGYCGHNTCLYNSITELNTKEMEWELISADNNDRQAPKRTTTGCPPEKRAYCAMVLFKDHGEDVLCVVGGEGWWPPTVKNVDFSHGERNLANKGNDVHCFNLTKRKQRSQLYSIISIISGAYKLMSTKQCCNHQLIFILECM